MGAPRTPKQKAIQAVVMSEVDGATSLEIGKRLNMPSSTVRDILAGTSQRWVALRNDGDYLRYAQATRRDLQISYAEIARQSLQQAEKELPSASYSQALLGSAIAVDKILKLDGDLRTDLHLHENIETIDELAKLLAEALVTSKE